MTPSGSAAARREAFYAKAVFFARIAGVALLDQKKARLKTAPQRRTIRFGFFNG